MEYCDELNCFAAKPCSAHNGPQLIHAKYLLQVNPAPVQVLVDQTVVVQDGKILDILPTNTVSSKYTSQKQTWLNEHILMPGLVNCHGHSPMTLLRGYADDTPLEQWLQEHIWPAEMRFVTEEFCRDGTELAMAEMIRSGTTCFTDMYFFPEESAKVVERVGMRAVLGCPILMFPTKWASTTDEYFSKGLDLLRSWRGHKLVHMSLAPHAPYTITDDQLERIKALEDEGAVIQMHVHETPTEVQDALAKGELRPLARLEKFGLLHGRFLAVHMTAVNDDDIKMVADSGANVVHCPESNTKLASGFCPVYKMMQAGVNVCLGTDGAASNNDLDMFGEMRTAALLGKLEAKNAAALNAGESLRMATINGAKALGLSDVTGSLEIGKSADMIAVRMSSVECTPFYNLASHLVYTVSRENVSDVWVDGKQLLRNRVLTTIDEQDVLRRAHAWAAKIDAAKRAQQSAQ